MYLIGAMKSEQSNAGAAPIGEPGIIAASPPSYEAASLGQFYAILMGLTLEEREQLFDPEHHNLRLAVRGGPDRPTWYLKAAGESSGSDAPDLVSNEGQVGAYITLFGKRRAATAAAKNEFVKQNKAAQLKVKLLRPTCGAPDLVSNEDQVGALLIESNVHTDSART